MTVTWVLIIVLLSSGYQKSPLTAVQISGYATVIECRSVAESVNNSPVPIPVNRIAFCVRGPDVVK